MQSVSPVFTEQEQHQEITAGPEHQEFFGVIALPVSLQLVDKETGKRTIVQPWGTSFRFRLTDEERAAVAAGKDLVLTQINMDQPPTPMNVQFCAEGERPSFGEVPDLNSLPDPENTENVIEMPKPLSAGDGEAPTN